MLPRPDKDTPGATFKSDAQPALSTATLDTQDGPASQYDESPYELASDTILWPWLRDSLAGTPIARLSSASGDKWAGYYDYNLEGPRLRDPRMFFKLGLVPAPTVVYDSEAAHKVYFVKARIL
jgi:hypothetical protein